ncbi:hypothetical protein ACFWZW_01730 [Microbacterium enclense]|uniref:hypothetical protein n=1 Tax=Microbacterium enclense TaxID=993073 RepID=UPI0036DA0E68
MSFSAAPPSWSRSPAARGLGELLGAAFQVLQRARHPRPLHPRGAILSGELRGIPDAAPAGIRWIDDAPSGPVPVIARVSRSLGLPAPLPDVAGLALRFEADGRPADVELASTGWHVPARFALLPVRRVERARFGTLLPYRGERGAVLLGARTLSGRPPATDPRELAQADPAAGWTLTLGHARAFGPWHPFARLTLRLDPDQDDRGLRFDAVRRPLPGAGVYDAVRAVRQPSYVRVQPADGPVRLPRGRTAEEGMPRTRTTAE